MVEVLENNLRSASLSSTSTSWCVGTIRAKYALLRRPVRVPVISLV